MKTLTTQVAALELEVVRLRNALETFIAEHEECEDGDGWMAQMCSMEALHAADEVLSTPFTPTADGEQIERWEPRIGTLERKEWQEDENRKARARLDAIRAIPNVTLEDLK